MPSSAAPLRRDAERNRRLLLDTARDLMAEHGLDVSYEEIARAAGTGMGTVYRRFPDRQDLVDALFSEHVDAVCRMAEDAAQQDDPWGALSDFLERQLELEAANRALGQILRGQKGSYAVAHHAHERMTPIVRALLDRAVRAGQLPDGVTSADLVAVHLMVGSVMDASRGVAPELWRRALAVALAGLQHAQLPTPAPADDVVDRLFATETT